VNPVPAVKDWQATKASTLLPAGSASDLPAETPVKLR
jgi:hypothetical protein